MASVFKRGDTWWVAYYVHGKLTRRSLKTTNKRVAEREKQALEAQLISPHRLVQKEQNPSVDVFWSKYVNEYAKEHKRPRAIERTESFWCQLLDFTKAQRLGDISKRDIEAFKLRRRQLGNSEQTVNNALRELKALFNRAIKMELYTGANPVTGVEMYPIDKRMPEFHTEKELHGLLSVAGKHGRILKRVVLLCGWAGLRKNELANTRWEWMDFDNPKGPVIHVKQFPGFDIKDHEDRSIPMNKRIYDEFYPDRQPEGFIFESGTQSQGRNFYRFDPKRSLMAALKEAGLTTADPFQRLRHTFGSLLAQKGVSIFKVSKWMGHSSVQVTERHYAGLHAYDPEIDSF